jgi:pilus assembly protein Flp/PilA
LNQQHNRKASHRQPAVSGVVSINTTIWEFVMSTITSAVKAFVADENGVTAIEYGLIAALIGVAMAGAAATLGDKIESAFNYVTSAIVLPA